MWYDLSNLIVKMKLKNLLFTHYPCNYFSYKKKIEIMSLLTKKSPRLFKNKGINRGHLFKFEELTSTNDFIKSPPLDLDLSHGDVIWAVKQTQGKGRLGRVWKSEAPDSLTFSILLHVAEITDLLKNISQIAAISLCDLLKEYDIISQIKWPNDVLIRGKKVAGILTEVLNSPKMLLIIGIGINLNNEIDFLKSIEKTSTSVKMEIGKKVDTFEFLEKFLIYFQTYFNLFVEAGFKVFFEKWEYHCRLVGKTIQVTFANKKKKALVTKLLADGGIEVQFDNQQKKIYSGEIS